MFTSEILTLQPVAGMPNDHLQSQFTSKWKHTSERSWPYSLFVACIVAIVGVKFDIGLDIFGLYQDCSGIDAI